MSVKNRQVLIPTARTFVHKDGEAETLRTEFIASTSAVDRYGDIVEQTWSLDAYKANPVILAFHDPTRVVGKAVKVGVADAPDVGQHLRIVVEWDMGDHNPDGTRIAEQFRRGVLSAGSVGFRPSSQIPRSSLPDDDPRKGDRGYVLSGNELLEFSAVAIPANPQAVAQRDLTDESVRDEVLRILRTDAEVRAIIRAMPLTEPAGCEHERGWFDTLSGDSADNWFGDLPTTTPSTEG